MSDRESYTKNKFELDRSDHDINANRTERDWFCGIYLLDEIYVIPVKCYIMIWRSHNLNGL